MNPDEYRFPLQTAHKIPATDDGEFGSVISPGGRCEVVYRGSDDSAFDEAIWIA